MNEILKVSAYLLLGSNLGDRVENLERARARLVEEAGQLASASKIYETAAWGVEDQATFLNQAIHLHTSFEAPKLLSCMLGIEKKMGRVRERKWGSRLIDIDMLIYADQVIETPDLTVPHPFLPQRRFALVPLAEIAPNLMHPSLKMSISQLLEQCNDQLEVVEYV